MAADKRLQDLIGGFSPFFDPTPPASSPFGSALGYPFGLAPNPSPWEPQALPISPPNSSVADIARASLLQVERPSAPLVAPRPEAQKRMVYFAFDFDDVIRVNNVRQTGKIGPRVMGGSRGFKDRSVWEASKAFTNRGLKEMMQRMSKYSSVVCVLVGTNTWHSRWVRYEIALSIINERGLLAIDLNSINHNIRRAPDPLGVNPLRFMGLHKDHKGNWYLVERQPVELSDDEVGHVWQWYDDYQQSVPKPKFVPDIEAGTTVPLSRFVKRYNFSANAGSINIGTWLDVAAIEAGR